MNRAQVLASLDAATASAAEREEKREIGALRSFVVTLGENHASIQQAPSDSEAAVGYWRHQKGALAPEWRNCGMMH